MRIIKRTTSWVVVRIKTNKECESLSSVSHTEPEPCFVLLKWSLAGVFLFSLPQALLALLIPHSQGIAQHCLCLCYSILGSLPIFIYQDIQARNFRILHSSFLHYVNLISHQAFESGFFQLSIIVLLTFIQFHAVSVVP